MDGAIEITKDSLEEVKSQFEYYSVLIKQSDSFDDVDHAYKMMKYLQTRGSVLEDLLEKFEYAKTVAEAEAATKEADAKETAL